MIQKLIQDYKGYTYNKKIVEDMQKIILEAKRFSKPPVMAECSIISILEKGEIKALGASIPNDLIMDNFGETMKVLSNRIGGGTTDQASITDITNSAQTIFLNDMNAGQSGSTFANRAGSVGTFGVRLQVGSGGTTPTRQDFNIENAFGTSPESLAFNTNPSGYNSGLGQLTFGNNITAGGAGTIQEVIAIMNMRNTINVQFKTLIFRDLVTPVGFIAGQIIAVDWVIQI